MTEKTKVPRKIRFWQILIFSWIYRILYLNVIYKNAQISKPPQTPTEIFYIYLKNG